MEEFEEEPKSVTKPVVKPVTSFSKSIIPLNQEKSDTNLHVIEGKTKSKEITELNPVKNVKPRLEDYSSLPSVDSLNSKGSKGSKGGA